MVFDNFEGVYEFADSYSSRPQRRCDCGAPIARTSSLHCCHVCYGKEREHDLRQMTTGPDNGRMDRYKHYAARR